MARDALSAAKALAELIARGQMATALQRLSAIHPQRMQTATIKRLEGLLSDADRRWFMHAWTRQSSVQK